ncbi:GDSL esterase/lipase At4g10955-like [Carex rostrata]
MPSQKNLFEVSGPAYLTSVNWSCPNDQRVVVASLVKATSMIEKDRVLAPAWWEHFHFDCKEMLRDVSDKSVYCCIYELKACFPLHPSAPRFIVTFRGTIVDRKHFPRDGYLDLLVTISGINKDQRLKIALDAVRRLISDYQETKKIWLAGYSLGASFATLTGKYIAKTHDIYLNTFLFNPPFPSISLDWFPNVNDKLKKFLCNTKTVIKGAGVSVLMPNQHKKSCEEFLKLAPWTPYLFVNPQDPISASYIRYFEGRKNTEGTILESMEQVASQISLRGICGDVLGKGSEMPHLLPSARLAVYPKKCDLHDSHRIHQWWQKDVTLKFDDYHYQPKKC